MMMSVPDESRRLVITRRLPSCFMNIAQFCALTIALVASSVKAEIRCYCNQPSCVSTGYMCKSNQGSCFTELFSYSNDMSKSRHGCVELLKPEKRIKCTSPTAEILNLPVIFCCDDDMCNYMNNIDINIQVNTRANASKTPDGAHDAEEERRAYEIALQQDVWFKAAVIAVPIAGGFILILLILLATRMLRQDSQRQRQLLELRRQHQRMLKPHHHHHHHQLFVGPQAAACCNGGKHNLSYTSSNLTVSKENWFNPEPNDRRYLYDKSLTDRTSICAALLPWPHQQKSSTHV